MNCEICSAPAIIFQVILEKLTHCILLQFFKLFDSKVIRARFLKIVHKRDIQICFISFTVGGIVALIAEKRLHDLGKAIQHAKLEKQLVYPTKFSNSCMTSTYGCLLPNMFLVEQYGMSLNIVKYRIGALFFLIGAGCLCTSIYYSMKQCSKRKRRIHQNDGNQPVMESKSSVTKVTLTNCKETSICNDQSIYDNLNTV